MSETPHRFPRDTPVIEVAAPKWQRKRGRHPVKSKANFCRSEVMCSSRARRAIATSRFVLASIFLLAIYIDPSQPSAAPDRVCFMLALYVLIALGMMVVASRSWWWDKLRFSLQALRHAATSLFIEQGCPPK